MRWNGIAGSSGVVTGNRISALSERDSSRISPSSSSGLPAPAGTIDRRSPSKNRKMRGLRGPTEGCALIRLTEAWTLSGRASACMKQGRVTGLGNASTSASTSAMDWGDVGAPSGATQRAVGPMPASLGFWEPPLMQPDELAASADARPSPTRPRAMRVQLVLMGAYHIPGAARRFTACPMPARQARH